MKPSKSTIYVGIILSLLASQCLVSGQGFNYRRFRSPQSQIQQIVPAIIGCGVGWLIGRSLARGHCHNCNENNNTAADCTEEEGCELSIQPTATAPTNMICRCDESVTSILKF
ncbi:uncharacterized protein LOC110462558 [Mizuhopecten yessoensis]|uniref:Uncharacterized protein n=1 Tax=Mizuhopecten yessoensis TaxID=6573 RepID=A0A210PY66_MIZYE|nr:uncharacterized protein LOC110462558 [Mizuhopecten yessoensis]OWF41389.1 hypothetical protein KP79_PYT22294 [Mizuhopecten yessoensis]